jgi:GNAT superfamily N-acetyltransferase
LGFLRAVGALLVITAAFSSGAVLGHRRQPRRRGAFARPRMLDGALLLLCWIGAVVISRSGQGFGKALLVGAFSALVLAFGHHCGVTRSAEEVVHTDPSSMVSPRPESVIHPHARAHGIRRLLVRWRSFARDVGGFQSRLFLSALYFLVLAPFGILAGRWGDPLKIKQASRDSYWEPKEATGEGLADARRQSS